MADKTIYTRAEFEALRQEKAAHMAADSSLLADALDVQIRASEHYWIHQTTWFGEPCLQVPGDMFAMQEIIFRTRPDWIIECGVAWGGSTLFYSTIMQAIGGEGIVGIDIFIPDDLRERLARFGPISERLHLLQRSSVDPDTVRAVREIIGPTKRVLVILDSNHTHEHVLEELRAFASFVRAGQYLVCADTTVERQPDSQARPRPWGRGNNPMTALREFMGETDRFEVDTALENKLLMTCNPTGYLRCVKDPP